MKKSVANKIIFPILVILAFIGCSKEKKVVPVYPFTNLRGATFQATQGGFSADSIYLINNLHFHEADSVDEYYKTQSGSAYGPVTTKYVQIFTNPSHIDSFVVHVGAKTSTGYTTKNQGEIYWQNQQFLIAQ